MDQQAAAEALLLDQEEQNYEAQKQSAFSLFDQGRPRTTIAKSLRVRMWRVDRWYEEYCQIPGRRPQRRHGKYDSSPRPGLPTRRECKMLAFELFCADYSVGQVVKELGMGYDRSVVEEWRLEWLRGGKV